MRYLIRSLLMCGLLVGILTTTALAAGQDFNFGLRPEDQTKGYFQYTLQPGEQIDDAVLVVNTSEQPQRIRVVMADGKTGLTGGIAFTDEAIEVAKWIAMPDSGELLVPGAKNGQPAALRLPFTLTVPTALAPGEYIFGFVARQVDQPENTASGFVVQVVPQSAVSIVVSVADPSHTPQINLPTISLNDGSDGSQWHFNIQIANQGQTGWQGTGRLLLKSAANTTILDLPFNIGYLIAGQSIEYPLYPDQIPPAGQYTVVVTLSGLDDQPLAEISQSISFGTILPTPTAQSILMLPTFEPTSATPDVKRTERAATLSAVLNGTPRPGDSPSDSGSGFIALTIIASAVFVIGVVALVVIRRSKP